MIHTKLPSFLQSLSLAALLAFSHLAWGGVVVAGQEIGKARWADRTTLQSKNFKIVETIESKLKGGRVLSVEGPLVAKLRGSAELLYDANDTLVGARILCRKPEEMLKRLAKASRARLDAENRYVSGDLRLRIIPTEGQNLVYITSEALDNQFIGASANNTENARTNWWAISLWLVGGSVGLAMLLALVIFIWRSRIKIWKTRACIADYLAAFTIVGAVMYAYPEARLGFIKVVLSAYILGCCFLLVWALRTVRHSGWLPRKPVVELLWALPAIPILLIPVILRNSFRSAHYAGMTLLFGQLLALAYYGFQPDLKGTIFLLAMFGLLGSGIARLYCCAFDFTFVKGWHPAARALLPLVIWPLHVIIVCAYFTYSMIVGALVVGLYMLIPAVILWFVGGVTQIEWLTNAAFFLPLLGLIPGVAGFLAMGTMPTGYSGLEFGTQSFNPSTGLPMMGAFDSAGNAFGVGGFEINPANGMHMFGGIGGFDAFGNTYGFNGNDPW